MRENPEQTHQTARKRHSERTRESCVLTGTSISPGLAEGRAFVFQDILERDLPDYPVEADATEAEWGRVRKAVDDVLGELDESAERIESELGNSLAEIFTAHRELLRDEAFVGEIRKEIESHRINAEQAVCAVVARWEKRFNESDEDVLKRYCDDISDLGRRLLRALTGVQMHSLEQMPEGSILLAHRLLPSHTIFFSRRMAAGIAVERGGPGSHCALLTRQIGIPGVAGIPDLTKRVNSGDPVLLNGLRGSVTIHPSAEAQARFRVRQRAYEETATRARKRAHLPATTVDGVEVKVMANIGDRHDAEMAAEYGADGVGLFRIEVFFIACTILPTEDELLQELSRTLTPLQDKSITVRLLDIGGDKQLSYLPLERETDPALGLRGVRFLLKHPELLRVQLRALLHLTKDFDIQIMVPMVTLAGEMHRVRETLEDVAKEIGCPRLPKLGAMVETPAAALCAGQLADVADFFNIGTNDLTQYTMAAGRENDSASDYYIENHPAIFHLLHHVSRESRNRPVGICGDLASRPEAVAALLRTGIQIFSVPPMLIPSIKETIRSSAAKPRQ